MVNVIQSFIFLIDTTPMTVASFAPDRKEKSGPPESPLKTEIRLYLAAALEDVEVS